MFGLLNETDMSDTCERSGTINCSVFIKAVSYV